MQINKRINYKKSKRILFNIKKEGNTILFECVKYIINNDIANTVICRNKKEAYKESL